jgi:hypothetical protein
MKKIEPDENDVTEIEIAIGKGSHDGKFYAAILYKGEVMFHSEPQETREEAHVQGRKAMRAILEMPEATLVHDFVPVNKRAKLN